MDEIGSMYYSEESFDDYYPGKGSTFPDLSGSVGILFEQASSRGHLTATDNGMLSFQFAIRNHVTTSLSTLKASQVLKDELLNYQHDFFNKAKSLSSNDAVKGYIFSAGKDVNKSNSFLDVLKRHEIEVSKLSQNYKSFSEENSFVVRLDQDKYRLIKAMFEKRTTFKDSLFYDVSAWTLPLAFGLQYEEISAKQLVKMSTNEVKRNQFSSKLEEANFGYLLPWDDYMAPTMLSKIQKAGIRTKLTTHEFSLEGRNNKPGTVFVPVQSIIRSY